MVRSGTRSGLREFTQAAVRRVSQGPRYFEVGGRGGGSDSVDCFFGGGATLAVARMALARGEGAEARKLIGT